MTSTTNSISIHFKKLLCFFIHIYQRTLSPYIGHQCKFYPTCSDYAIEAINKKPLHKACWIIIVRIFRCNPWSKGGFDEVL